MRDTDLTLWNLADAPDDLRRLVPDGGRESWIAILDPGVPDRIARYLLARCRSAGLSVFLCDGDDTGVVLALSRADKGPNESRAGDEDPTTIIKRLRECRSHNRACRGPERTAVGGSAARFDVDQPFPQGAITLRRESMSIAHETRSCAQILCKKIAERTAHVGVLGLGYVGLPLAVEFGQAGFKVTGVDVLPEKVRQLNEGASYIQDVPGQSVADLVMAGKFAATTDFSAIAALDTINIAVPTPLRKTKDPDMSYVVLAAEAVAAHLHPGMLIVLESTTYPGTTEELLLPMFEKTGLRAGADFFLCFSPERVDPGNSTYRTKNIPKVVGGVTPACTEMGRLFYSQALDKVVPVGSPTIAEMVKLLENTFRMINIGLVNELAMMCDRMGINVWEVIDAAATKPFGFMPFYPGPGLGGHCIPIDPFYLSWKTKQAGIEARFIELAGYVNGQMPQFVVDKVQLALNNREKALKGSHVHVAGVAYKRDIDDLRESPALDVILLLEKRGARVSYSDPYVPTLKLDGRVLQSEDLLATARQADCTVIVTDHSQFDYTALAAAAPLIVDTRNAMRSVRSSNVVRL